MTSDQQGQTEILATFQDIQNHFSFRILDPMEANKFLLEHEILRHNIYVYDLLLYATITISLVRCNQATYTATLSLKTPIIGHNHIT